MLLGWNEKRSSSDESAIAERLKLRNAKKDKKIPFSQ